jgi:hypothetical protein
MQKIAFLSLALTFFVACTTAKKLPVTDLQGRWKEYWIAKASDVAYNDVYKISVGKKGKIAINCPERPNYKFENIEFDGSKLQFTLNNSGNRLPYDLVVKKEGKLFVGSAISTKGDKVTIRWEKL